jgi:hypothetical protein
MAITMKKIITIILISAASICSQIHITLSQNLIPNPGFEVYDTCPYQFKMVASEWLNIEYHPDYFNSCAPLNIYSVPNNMFGHQYANSGCGCEGLGCYDWHAPNLREFLQTKLDTTLQPGTKYYISFYLSLGDGYPQYWAGTNKFGCKLSVNSFSPGVSDSSPAVDNSANFYSDSIVTDTIGWAKISGSFIADSAYNYIAFGCFFDSLNVQHIILQGTHIFTYYYLDDVCLSPDSATCISVSQPCYVPNGIEEYEDNKNHVFPNPFNDELKITMDNYHVYTLVLFNVYGARVLQMDFTHTANVNTAMLSQGLYFYKITDTDGKVISGKILKE